MVKSFVKFYLQNQRRHTHQNWWTILKDGIVITTNNHQNIKMKPYCTCETSCTAYSVQYMYNSHAQSYLLTIDALSLSNQISPTFE